MFLFSINTCCKESLCKTTRQIFHYKTHNKRPPRGTKLKSRGNSFVWEEIIFNSCFDFDFCVKECLEHLENPAENESDDGKQPWILVSRADSTCSAKRKSSIPRSL